MSSGKEILQSLALLQNDGYKLYLMTAEIDPKLLEILVCPLTKGALRYDKAAGELISEQAKTGLPHP